MLEFAPEFMQVASTIPDPGSGSAPPGATGFLAMLSWVKWLCLAVCVGAIMIAGAALGIGSRRGEGGEHASRLLITCAAVIVVTAAFSVTGFLAEATASSPPAQTQED